MQKGIMFSCFPSDMSVPARFELAKAAGFDGIEIPINEEMINSEERVREFLELSKRTLPICSATGAVGWRPSLTDADEGTRKRAVELLKGSLRTARKLGIDAILVVPGVVGSLGQPLQPLASYAEAWERSTAAIREAAPVAEEERVYLSVENVWNKFLLSPLEMARFIDEIGSPFVGSYFDVGNVLNFGFPQHWIETLGPRIKRVHIKDFKVAVGNIQGFVPLLEGDVNWPVVMAALRKVGYDGWITAEVAPYKHLPEKGIRDLASTMGEIINL